MQKLKRNFQYPEGAIASYSYTDLADGTGVIVFYLSQAATSAGVVWTLDSRPTNCTGGSGNNKFSETGDTDFNLTAFNTPRVVKGTAYLTGWLDWASSSAIAIQCTIKKVTAGGVVTSISSMVESQSAALDQGMTIPIPLTQTQFRAGDNLRITLKKLGGNGGLIIDPTNAINTTPTCKLLMPFRIDT